MNPEKKPGRRITDRRFWLAAATSLLLLPPVLNFRHTAFVLEAMSQHRADCSYNVQPSNQEGYPYDVIVVPGTEPDSPDWLIRKRGAEVALSKGLAPEIIVLGQDEQSSFNTATNMEELSEKTKRRGLNIVLVVTNAYHTLRATLLACANGVAASSMPAEAFLIEQDIKSLPAINEMMGIKIKEAIGTISLLWDHKGEIPTFFRRMAAK